MIKCFRCHRTPSEIDEYLEAVRGTDTTPEQYVQEEESTLNFRTGHFACTDCYIAIGMPSSRYGWQAP